MYAVSESAAGSCSGVVGGEAFSQLGLQLTYGPHRQQAGSHSGLVCISPMWEPACWR
ncbi:hypothetical protein EMIT0P218_10777 [Pseudomonas sp. IT-P218]